jgi:hypothetical protein
VNHEVCNPVDAALPVDDNPTQDASGEAPKKSAFDYKGVSNGNREKLLKIVERIKKGHDLELKAKAEIGKELLQAKVIFGHGNFGGWLQSEFQWSVKTANNYMSLAKNFIGKIATVTNMKLSTAYALVAESTPMEIRDELLTRVEAGENISREDVRKRVADSKVAGRKPAAKAKKAESCDSKKVEAATVLALATADDAVMRSEPLTTEAETSPATGKSPAEEMAQALLNALRVSEKNGPLCESHHVALLLWKDKRIPMNIKECVECVLEVLAELAAQMPS